MLRYGGFIDVTIFHFTTKNDVQGVSKKSEAFKTRVYQISKYQISNIPSELVKVPVGVAPTELQELGGGSQSQPTT